MARKQFRNVTEEYDRGYMAYLIQELSNLTGLIFFKSERIEVNGNDSTELVITSPNGTKYKLDVDDAGNITTTATI